MLFLFFFVVLIFSLKNRDYVLGIFLSILLLLPSEARIYPIPISCILLLSFFVIMYSYIYNTDFSLEFYRSVLPPLIYCVYYAFIRILWAFLGTYFSASEILTVSFFNVFIFVFAIVAVWKMTVFMLIDKANKLLLFILFVISLYGFVAYFCNRNFYIEILSVLSPNMERLFSISQRYAEEVRGALSSRLSGVTFSPLQYAIMLNAYIYFLFYQIFQNKVCRNKLLIVTVLVFLNIFMTGSRGPLVALLLPVLYFSFLYNNFAGKLKLLFGIAILLLALFVVPGFDSYASFIKSFIFFFDETYSQQAQISGSSISGRTMQMEAAYEILTSLDFKTILFGYGDGYHLYYVRELAENKVVTGEFEGVLMSATLNYGVLGFIFIEIIPWSFICLLILFYRKRKMLSKRDSYILYSMFITDVITCFLVGQCARILYYTIFFYLLKQMIEQNFSFKLYNLKLIKDVSF